MTDSSVLIQYSVELCALAIMLIILTVGLVTASLLFDRNLLGSMKFIGSMFDPT